MVTIEILKEYTVEEASEILKEIEKDVERNIDKYNYYEVNSALYHASHLIVSYKDSLRDHIKAKEYCKFKARLVAYLAEIRKNKEKPAYRSIKEV